MMLSSGPMRQSFKRLPCASHPLTETRMQTIPANLEALVRAYEHFPEIGGRVTPRSRIAESDWSDLNPGAGRGSVRRGLILSPARGEAQGAPGRWIRTLTYTRGCSLRGPSECPSRPPLAFAR